MQHHINNLGCAIERVAGNFHSLTVDLHVPARHCTDMGGAVEYAQAVMPNVLTINVFEGPRDELQMVYRWNAVRREWVAFVAAVK